MLPNQEWKTWNEYLFKTFVAYRLSPGWSDLYECHDTEDREYFWMLENDHEKNKISVRSWS